MGSEMCIRDRTSNVSKKTDFVVVGSDPGSKLDQANLLEINILDETQFGDLLQSLLLNYDQLQ